MQHEPWPASVPGAGPDGRPFEALVPRRIAGMSAVGGFAEAEAAVREADALVSGHPDRNEVVGSLLHAESLSIALVNRLATGTRYSLGKEPFRAMAAFRRAVAIAVEAPVLDLAALKGIHRSIVPRGGELRTRQVWLSAKSPADASFVPPPTDYLSDLVDDLITYLRRDDVSPLEQAAVAFAQLDFIHPFTDGNGRTGRCLLQVIARRRGLVHTVAAPLGLLFAAHLPNFFDAHRAWRDGDHASWCRYVAGLALVSARNMHAVADGMAKHKSLRK